MYITTIVIGILALGLLVFQVTLLIGRQFTRRAIFSPYSTLPSSRILTKLLKEEGIKTEELFNIYIENGIWKVKRYSQDLTK